VFNSIGATLQAATGKLLGTLRKHRVVLAILGAGLIVGVGLCAVYATAIQYTNTLGFCAHTCHEMESTVYPEYMQSKHFKNEHGVVITCANCHVPHNNWLLTLNRKIHATFELWGHFTGKINTAEKFEAHRLEMAQKVWAGFAATNARECKACHNYANMLLEEQRPSVQVQHADAMKTDENCIECHKGLVHKLPNDPAAPPPPADFDLN
jgi:nitrate/TMAO reductase-like tetraheme cytochrome c subunit